MGNLVKHPRDFDGLDWAAIIVYLGTVAICVWIWWRRMHGEIVS